jgi:hypothetical protein
MLHDLMRRSGHPSPPFGNGCPLTWDTWPDGPGPDVIAAGLPLD